MKHIFKKLQSSVCKKKKKKKKKNKRKKPTL